MKRLLEDMFRAAVAAAQPARVIAEFLPEPPKGRTIVVGAGKAAASMAAALEAHWHGPLQGLVVTRTGHGLPTKSIEVVEASHPVPDARGEAAARRILAMVRGLSAEDLVICLISGGASALLSLPAPGVTFEDKRAINKALLASGAPIGEMNTVRKHLSAIKGGRLALAVAPARIVTLAISDVPGDDFSVIGSGPTAPDRTTSAEALAILEKYAIAIPDHVRKHLLSKDSETPKPGDPAFARVDNRLIASPKQSLAAAALMASAGGYKPILLGDAIEGEAREVGKAMAATALSSLRQAPCCLLSGGETTVTMHGGGRGGRNAEFLLSLMIALDGHAHISALAADTDGIDGSEDNAGAWFDVGGLARARALGLDPAAFLADNDAYTFFERLGGLVVTGPTLTNVNDFRAILIAAA